MKVIDYCESLINKHYRKKTSKIVQEVESIIKPMDLVLCKTNYYPSNFLISGYWSHVVIRNWDGNYLQADLNKNVILSTAVETLAHRSSMLILRCNLPTIENYENLSRDLIADLIGKPYDHNYKFNLLKDDGNYYCTELILRIHSLIYPGLPLCFKTPRTYFQKNLIKFLTKFGFGSPVLVDDFLKNKFYQPLYRAEL